MVAQTAGVDGIWDETMPERVHLDQWRHPNRVSEIVPVLALRERRARSRLHTANGRIHLAGKLRVVVIPDVRDRLPFEPFEPKAPADLLTDIETYLADKTPPYLKVEVVNAHYVLVKVRVGVRFKPGYDEGFYTQRLNDDLNRRIVVVDEGGGDSLGMQGDRVAHAVAVAGDGSTNPIMARGQTGTGFGRPQFELDDTGASADRIFHLHPFGYNEVQPDSPGG